MLGVHGVARAGADYYLSDLGRELPAGGSPCWTGTAGADLGLRGEIDPAGLHRLLEGRHPLTDRAIGSGRTRVVGWDLTFSAPKSVSVLFAVGGPRRRGRDRGGPRQGGLRGRGLPGTTWHHRRSPARSRVDRGPDDRRGRSSGDPRGQPQRGSAPAHARRRGQSGARVRWCLERLRPTRHLGPPCRGRCVLRGVPARWNCRPPSGCDGSVVRNGHPRSPESHPKCWGSSPPGARTSVAIATRSGCARSVAPVWPGRSPGHPRRRAASSGSSHVSGVHGPTPSASTRSISRVGQDRWRGWSTSTGLPRPSRSLLTGGCDAVMSSPRSRVPRPTGSAPTPWWRWSTGGCRRDRPGWPSCSTRAVAWCRPVTS